MEGRWRGLAIECHGHEGDIACLKQQLRGCHIGATMCASAAAGGTVTVISAALASQFSSIRRRPLCEGRVLLSHCVGPHGALCIINVHMPNTCHGHQQYRRVLHT
eukprot:6271118-Pyramimonas_sp.AAC.1